MLLLLGPTWWLPSLHIVTVWPRALRTIFPSLWSLYTRICHLSSLRFLSWYILNFFCLDTDILLFLNSCNVVTLIHLWLTSKYSPHLKPYKNWVFSTDRRKMETLKQVSPIVWGTQTKCLNVLSAKSLHVWFCLQFWLHLSNLCCKIAFVAPLILYV